ncbi:unnamed protein product [Enterobius vermicularis]|uniref:Bravo_FIGEY domain-containing protein n=1 Tax=Enterobius vermicularis TaxID=51028 RepID=A0A0N4VIN1_ENTVE|nr:unnamed protein product [Enterobius vermicularis]
MSGGDNSDGWDNNEQCSDETENADSEDWYRESTGTEESTDTSRFEEKEDQDKYGSLDDGDSKDACDGETNTWDTGSS